MTSVGQDFRRCPYCGPIADVDEERSTEKVLVLYCHHCGSRGEIERLHAADRPVRWKPGVNINEVGRTDEDGGVLIQGGWTMAGTAWVRLTGSRPEVLAALVDSVKSRAENLIRQDREGLD